MQKELKEVELLKLEIDILESALDEAASYAETVVTEVMLDALEKSLVKGIPNDQIDVPAAELEKCRDIAIKIAAVELSKHPELSNLS